MNVVKAMISKRISDDGFMEFEDHISSEQVYFVDLDSIQMVKGYNTVKNQEWERKMIIDVLTGEWMPLELLSLDLDAKCDL